MSRLLKIGHIAMRWQWNGVAFGARTLWVAAAVTWNLGILVALSLQEEPNRTTRANQEMDSGESELRKSRLRDQATLMARALARQASDQTVSLKQGAESGMADLQKSLQQDRDQASKLEQDLAAARRDLETQTALAVKAGEEVAQLKQVAEKGSAEQRQSLQQERDKAEALAQELSTARSKIYAYEAQARQAGDQTPRVDIAPRGRKQMITAFVIVCGVLAAVIMAM